MSGTSTTFYPSITELIRLDQIPLNMGTFQDNLDNLLKDIYYKDFYSDVSHSGDAASYRLKLLSYGRLAINIPGTNGMALVLNPEFTLGNITTIPISFSYRIEILKYIKGFKLSQFKGDPIDFFDFFIAAFGISLNDLFEEAIYTFFEEGDTQLQEFVDEYNTAYPSTQISSFSDITDIIEQIKNGGNDAYLAIFELIINTGSNFEEKIEKLRSLFYKWLGDFTTKDIINLFIPQISLSINNINLALEFPRTMLIPLETDEDLDDNEDTLPGTPLPETYKSLLRFNVGSLLYSTENGLEFVGENSFSFTKSQIGNTGFTLEFNNMKLDLSRKTNIPEATADGRPNDFIGVFVERATIGLPPTWVPDSSGGSIQLVGKNLLLGTGGISGTIGIERENEGELLHCTLGSLRVALDSFDITFLQNKIISSNVTGSLEIEGLKDANGNTAHLEIDIHFEEDGDFKITAKEKDGLKLAVPGVFTYFLQTLSVGKENGKFFLGTSGKIDFTDQGGAIGKIFQDPIDIEQLIIWEDGSIQIKGADASYKLKKPKTLKIGPAKITVTAIHFGTYEQMHGGKLRKYWFFGFDGGVSINPGGIDARGDGIKFYFSVDNDRDNGRPLHVFLRIQSIAIDLIIPGKASKESAAVLLSGYLAMKDASTPGNPDAAKGTEYIGGVSITLPKVKISGTAAMRLNPSVPAFIVDIGLSLPTPIPLGSTGLGIYGFRGLFGQRYVATKEAAGLTEDAPWYQYYKAKVSPDYKEGIQVSKFSNKDGFSIGAGASIATASDGGFTFSSKIFFMLSLPDVFLIEGQAAILATRVDMDTKNDPPFYMMLAISDKSVEAAFGVTAKIPADSGAIVDVNGLTELGFFFSNAGAWYINIGRDTPQEKRIRAKIFNLFSMYFYLMMNKSGIRTGGGISTTLKIGGNFAGFEANVYMDMNGRISFKPVQIGAAIGMGGSVSLKFWKFRFTVNFSLNLGAEAPKPFILSGSANISVRLPLRIRLTVNVAFTWTFSRNRDTSEIQLLVPTSVMAYNIMSQETFPVCAIETGPGVLASVPGNINNYIIPVDSYIDIEFLKGMGLASTTGLDKFGPVGMGSVNTEFVPPQKGLSQQVQHTYKVQDIQIYSLDANNQWQPYNVHEALTPLANTNVNFTVPSGVLSNLKYGYWQMQDPGKYNKLRILAQSPISYIGQADLIIEEQGFEDGFLFCADEKRTGTCVLFENTPAYFKVNDKRTIDKLIFVVKNKDGYVVNQSSNPFSLNKALAFSDTLEIFTPKAAAELKLSTLTYSSQGTISYYKIVPDGSFANGVPKFRYDLVKEKTFTGNGVLASPDSVVSNDELGNIVYNDLSNPIDKIVITNAGGCSTDGFLDQENDSYIWQENASRLVLEEENPYQCQTLLYKVCWLNVIDASFNTTIKGQAAVNADLNAMGQSFQQSLQPIWRPDTIFNVRIDIRDEVTSDGINHDRHYNLIFKTAGPVGHFHKYQVNNAIQLRPDYQKLLSIDKEDQYMLASLRNYIDYSRSYPNADGKLVNAKPLFYKNPKLLLFYKYNYVYTMFNDFAAYPASQGRGANYSRLDVLIKDPTEPVSSNPETPTTAPVGGNVWSKDTQPNTTKEMRTITNLVNGKNCSGFQGIINPLSVKQEVVPPADLQPDKLYTAVFNGVFKGADDANEDSTQIHNYVFKTSRYGDFAEQVNSCRLLNDSNTEVKKAIYTIENNFTSVINDAKAIFTTPDTVNDPKGEEYADKFDRLMDGILQLGAVSPAETTDFNIIKNTDGNKIIGLLIRNPEPFNDPKIPESVLADTIQVSVNGTTLSRVLFSKEKAKMFITNDDMDIATGNFSCIFKYKQYNGRAYEQIGSSVTIDFTV